MFKILRSITGFALALCLGTSVASAETFEIEVNFDDPASFSQGGVLPDGWSQTLPEYYRFERQTGAYFGFSAQSGDYVLGCAGPQADGVVYTAPVKLAGGKEAAIEFQALMPGGNPPSVRNWGFTVFAGTTADIAQMQEIGHREHAQLAAWEKFVYTFTPEADGEYYYAIRLDQSNLDMAGAVLFDTFFFSGTKPEEQPVDPPVIGDPASTYPGMELLEPDDANLAECHELPYFEDFSDAEHYDGTSSLPIGWKNTGTTIWRTAKFSDVFPAAGDYYMCTPMSDYSRDERAYTPFFNLQQGVTYTLTFSTHQASFLWDEEENIRRITTINVKAGTQQDAEFLPVTLKVISEDNPANEWTEHSITFCPAVSGAYTFCFELEGLPYSGIAAVDDFRITSPVDLARPEPGFAARAIFNLLNSKLLSLSGEPVRFVNTSLYADRVEWDCTQDFNVLPNGDIDVFFTTDGPHAISINAINERGSRSTSREFDVECVSEDSDQMAIIGYDPSNSTILNRGELIRFATDPLYDFVGGYNHYYRTYAEYCPLPRNSQFKISSISLWLGWLNYRTTLYGETPADIDDQRILPFKVSIYAADENGNVDESKCYGSFDTTMAEVFGETGIAEVNGRNVNFPEPIVCDGPIFVVLEFSDKLAIDVADPNLVRSYLGHIMVRHGHRQTSLYVKPYAVPEGSDAKVGEWCPIQDLDKTLKGLGLSMQLWTSYENQSGSVAIDGMGNVTFAARYIADTIQVSGTTEGEWLAVYTTDGRCVAMQQAADGATVIDAPGLPDGVYVVRGNNGSTKFVK